MLSYNWHLTALLVWKSLQGLCKLVNVDFAVHKSSLDWSLFFKSLICSYGILSLEEMTGMSLLRGSVDFCRIMVHFRRFFGKKCFKSALTIWELSFNASRY